MTIYLDNMRHLFSDESVEELWEFAQMIGLKERWNHYSRGFPHFDLMKGKIKDAVLWGANEISFRDPEWSSIATEMNKVTFNRAWHEECARWYPGTGLLGQRILRLKIPETIELERLYETDTNRKS